MNIGVNTVKVGVTTRVITGVKVMAATKTTATATVAAIAILLVHGEIRPPQDYFSLLGRMCNHFQYRPHPHPNNRSNRKGSLLQGCRRPRQSIFVQKAYLVSLLTSQCSSTRDVLEERKHFV
jgi:hypothetical protein